MVFLAWNGAPASWPSRPQHLLHPSGTGRLTAVDTSCSYLVHGSSPFLRHRFCEPADFFPCFPKKTLRSSRFFRYLLLLVPFFDVFIPAYPLSDSHVLSCHFYCFPFFLVLRFPIVPYTFFEACFFGDSFFFISLLPPYFFPLPVFRLPPLCDSCLSLSIRVFVEPEGSVPMNAEKIFTQVVVVVAAFYVKTRRISCPSHCLSRFPVPCSEFRIFDNKWHRLGHWHHRRDKGPEILRVLQKNRAAQEIPGNPSNWAHWSLGNKSNQSTPVAQTFNFERSSCPFSGN